MGKGRIIQVDGDGSYWVEIIHDMQSIIDQKKAVEKSRSELLEPLARARHDADVAHANAVNARGVLNQAISSGDAEWMQEAATESARATSIEGATNVNWSMIDAEYTGKTVEIQSLETALSQRDPVVFCWCADHTIDLDPGAEVGTIEIPDEYNPDRPLMVQPGWRSDDPKAGAAWSQGRDGCLVRANAQGPYQAYYNAVMLPGLQKDKPYYRVGELLQIKDGDGYVVIDREQSSASRSSAYKLFTADGFHINPPGADTSDQALNVIAPIIYMDCNDAAFTEGDRVVVYFGGSWDTPQIIGFEANPVPCSLTGFLCFPSANDDFRNGWAEPFTDNNKPLGTVFGTLSGDKHRNTLVTPDGEFLRGGDPEYLNKYPIDAAGPVAGSCDWFGDAVDGRRISWDTTGHRYFGEVFDQYDGGFSYAQSYLPGQRIVILDNLYRWISVKVLTVDDDLNISSAKKLRMNKILFNGRDALDVPFHIINGAGIAEHLYIDTEGNNQIVRWLIYVTYADPTVTGGPQPIIDYFHAVQILYDGDKIDVVSGTHISLGEVTYSEISDALWLPSYGAWSFSGSGRKAAAIRNDTGSNPTIGYNLLFEVEFSVDEQSVLMPLPTVTVMANGTLTWNRSFGDNGATFYQGNAKREEVIAVDYSDNKIVMARLVSNVTEIVDVSDSFQVGIYGSYSGYMSNGYQQIDVNTVLMIDDNAALTVEGSSKRISATYTADGFDGNPGTATYSCDTSTADSVVSKYLTGLDLRNGYFSYSMVVDNTQRPERYSGASIGQNKINFDWSGEKDTLWNGAFSDHYQAPGSVWSGNYLFDQTEPLSGTGDPLDSRNTVGINVDWISSLAPPGTDSGTKDVFGAVFYMDFYRPSSAIVSKNGREVAISNANGFGRPTWYSSGGTKEFTNWPDDFTDKSGLSGYSNPRLCPLNVL